VMYGLAPPARRGGRVMDLKPAPKPLVSKGLFKRPKRNWFDEIPSGALRAVVDRRPWLFDPDWTGSGQYFDGRYPLKSVSKRNWRTLRTYGKRDWRRRLRLARAHGQAVRFAGMRDGGGYIPPPVPVVAAAGPAAAAAAAAVAAGVGPVAAAAAGAAAAAAVEQGAPPRAPDQDIVMRAPAEDIVMRRDYPNAQFVLAGKKKQRDIIPGEETGEQEIVKWYKKGHSVGPYDYEEGRPVLLAGIDRMRARADAEYVRQAVRAAQRQEERLRGAIAGVTASNAALADDVRRQYDAEFGLVSQMGSPLRRPRTYAPAAGGAGVPALSDIADADTALASPAGKQPIVREPDDARFKQIPAGSVVDRIMGHASGLMRGGLKRVVDDSKWSASDHVNMAMNEPGSYYATMIPKVVERLGRGRSKSAAAAAQVAAMRSRYAAEMAARSASGQHGRMLH